MSLDIQIDSKARSRGHPHDFNIQALGQSLQNEAYAIALQSAQIPNQAFNVFTGITDTFYVQFRNPTATSDAVPKNTPIKVTIPQGYYIPSTLATAIQLAINTLITAEPWGTNPVSVTYSSTFVALVVKFNSSDLTVQMAFCSSTSESTIGFPATLPSVRFYQMSGLTPYTIEANNPSCWQGVFLFTYNPTSGIPVSMGGSDYVDIVTNMHTSTTYHSNPGLTHTIARIPLGNLFSTISWQRNTDEVSAVVVDQNYMKDLRIALIDEWGLPFTLPDNQSVAMTFRLVPITVADVGRGYN